MTTIRDKAIDVVTRETCPVADETCPGCRGKGALAVDALLAAGMLTDPEECARTYSLISELIATGKDDDAERAYRLAVKAWRRARDVADGKPLPPRDDEARDALALDNARTDGQAVTMRAVIEWCVAMRAVIEWCVDALVAAGLIRPAHDDAAYVAMREEFIRIIDDADSCIHAQPSKESLATTLVCAARAALAAADQEDTDG